MDLKMLNLSNDAYVPKLRSGLLPGACFDKKGTTFKGGRQKTGVIGSVNVRLFSAKLQNVTFNLSVYLCL